MGSIADRLRQATGDFIRLIAPMDVICQLGNLIFRKSLRYTLLTAGISAVGLLLQWIGLPGFTVRQAILLPLVIGAVTLTIGVLLKVVPAIIASRLLTVAQAGDLNLMEDYRKSQAGEHLEALWEGAYRQEAWLDSPAADWNESQAKETFLQTAHGALGTPLPQMRQLQQTGLDLRFFEDWRDGAYLDRSDSKLREQFEGSSLLKEARRIAGMTGLAFSLRWAPAGASQAFWFSLVTRALATRVAPAVENINHRFDGWVVNCQTFLWPGEEDHPWLVEKPQARDAVLESRRKIITGVFGPTDVDAVRMIDRMLFLSVRRARELRLRIDPSYALGERPGDGEARGPRAGETLRRAHEAFREYIAANRPELLADDSRRRWQAVRAAFHADVGGLRGQFLRVTRRGGSKAQLPLRAWTTIDRAIESAGRTGRILLAVRAHHVLAELERAGYRDLILRLQQSERAKP